MEHQGVVVHQFRVPDTGVESLQSAVKRVGTIVHRHVIFLSVQGELALGDAVSKSTDEARKIGFRRINNILNVVMALNDVG